MKIHSAVLSLISLIASRPLSVDGAAAVMRCEASPCLESVTESCESIRLWNDFNVDGGCCYALTDTADGGCGITIKSPPEESSCSRSTRGDAVTIGDSVNDGLSMVGSPFLSYTFQTLPTEDTGCPASAYPVESSSQSGMTPYATMTLTGVNKWSEIETEAWIELTNDFIKNYVPASTPYTDIISQIQVYADGGAVLNTDARSATLTYYHSVGWRNSTEDVTLNDILDAAFNTDAGSGEYLKALYASDNSVLSGVTDSSGFAEVEPSSSAPTEEEGEEDTAPGGAGAGAVQTHDADPTFPPSAAEVDPAVLEEPAPAPDKSATTSRKLGLSLMMLVAMLV